jgi:hypothetical protein
VPNDPFPLPYIRIYRPTVRDAEELAEVHQTLNHSFRILRESERVSTFLGERHHHRPPPDGQEQSRTNDARRAADRQ